MTNFTDKQLIEVITRSLMKNAKRFAEHGNTAKTKRATVTARERKRSKGPKQSYASNRKK